MMKNDIDFIWSGREMRRRYIKGEKDMLKDLLEKNRSYRGYDETRKVTEEELREWHRKSGLPLKRFFNTSGMKYRELELKDKLPTMTEEEQYQLLATDGMLVKRPLLLGEDFAIPGFKENEWAKACALAE